MCLAPIMLSAATQRTSTNRQLSWLQLATRQWNSMSVIWSETIISNLQWLSVASGAFAFRIQRWFQYPYGNGCWGNLPNMGCGNLPNMGCFPNPSRISLAIVWEVWVQVLLLFRSNKVSISLSQALYITIEGVNISQLLIHYRGMMINDHWIMHKE